MPEFKINNQTVSAKDWNEFVETIRKADPAVTGEIIKDREITSDEMRALLDAPKTRALAPSLFSDIESLRQKYNFKPVDDPAKGELLARAASEFVQITADDVSRIIESLDGTIQWVETYYQCTDDKDKLNSLQELVAGLKQQRDSLQGFLEFCNRSPDKFFESGEDSVAVRDDVAYFLAYAKGVDENLKNAENAALAVVWEDIIKHDWRTGNLEHTAQIIDKILPFIQNPSFDIQVAEIDANGKIVPGEDGRPKMRPLLPDKVRARLSKELSGIAEAKDLLIMASSLFRNGYDDKGKKALDDGLELLHKNEELVQEVVGKYYSDYMDSVRDVSAFDKFRMTIADGSVIAAGAVGVAASGFTLSPVIAGAESAYWLARLGMDVSLRTAATGKFTVTPGDVAMAVASTVPLAGGLVSASFRSGKIVLTCTGALAGTYVVGSAAYEVGGQIKDGLAYGFTSSEKVAIPAAIAQMFAPFLMGAMRFKGPGFKGSYAAAASPAIFSDLNSFTAKYWRRMTTADPESAAKLTEWLKASRASFMRGFYYKGRNLGKASARVYCNVRSGEREAFLKSVERLLGPADTGKYRIKIDPTREGADRIVIFLYDKQMSADQINVLQGLATTHPSFGGGRPPVGTKVLGEYLGVAEDSGSFSTLSELFSRAHLEAINKAATPAEKSLLAELLETDPAAFHEQMMSMPKVKAAYESRLAAFGRDPQNPHLNK